MAVTASGKDKLQRHMRLLVGGYDLSGDARALGSASYDPTEVDMTGWSNTVMQYLTNIPEVVLDGFEALMNDDTGRAYDVLKTSGGAANLHEVSLLFGGGGEPAIGDPAFVMGAVQLGDMVASSDGVAVVTANFRVDASSVTSFAYPHGVVLHGNTAETATFSSTSVDLTNGVYSLANGAQAIIHVTSAESTGTWTFTIEDSANDSTWASLVSFTVDGTSITSERVTVAGAVDRYVRLTGTNGTATSCTFAVTFAPVIP